MNKSTSSWALLAISLFYAANANAQIEEFTYSGPITGLADVYPNGGYGGFEVNFESVTENFYYNPQADTIEEVGTVTCNVNSGSFNIYSEQGSGVIGSASVTIGNGNGWSFDETISLSKGYATKQYPLAGSFGMAMPVTGTVNLNGQTSQGTWDYRSSGFSEAQFALTPNGLEVNEFLQSEENGGPPLGSFAGFLVYNGPPYDEWIQNVLATPDFVADPVPDSTSLLSEVPLILLFGGAASRLLRRPPARGR